MRGFDSISGNNESMVMGCGCVWEEGVGGSVCVWCFLEGLRMCCWEDGNDSVLGVWRVF